MDAATVLEQYTQDLSNLPSELAHLLEELRYKDMSLYQIRKRAQGKDNQLHKYIKQHGSLVKHPKEQQLYSKINEDFTKAKALQEEKILLSNTALLLISKHLVRLESDIEKLESEGLIAPDDMIDEDKNMSDGMSSLTPVPPSQSSTPGVIPKKRQRNGASRTQSKFESPPLSASAPTRTHRKKNASELNQTGEEDELYCFCQQVSFGDMIACDNPDCKYEWFHYDCVGLTAQPPSGIWYCPDCKNDQSVRKRDRKKKKVEA
ncbi:BA75_02864T0 [Komagataella pastoris]|uniref:Chromatin modification-related protein n=1 Tax=Komagataella pastoris TaxID=4922 RepID=A0A1B2JBM4_PICPA|nr:BA75_02864T0 [Komagataella pastoris]